MRRETELELLRRFFKYHEDRATELAESVYRNPAASYTDPARLRREWEALFWGRPLLVALSGDLPGIGDYVATQAAGVPLLIVRGEDAELRCFLNVCRHRGSPVARGRGHPGRVFSCPYHAWTYDLDGQLLGQPLARGGFDEIDRAETGLIPVPVAERYGLVFVRPGGTSPIDAEEHLSGMGDELAGLGFDRMRFFAERSGVWDMNWKQAVDTFTESYHVFALHRETIAGDFLSAPAATVPFGPHNFTAAFRRSVTQLRERDEPERHLREHAGLVYRIFPNVIFNLPIDGHAELWEVYPEDGSPHRTRISMKFYTPREVTTDKERNFWKKNFDITVKVVFEEDFDAQAEIHRGLRSGLLPELVYGRNEPDLIRFHTEIEKALGE